MKEKMIQLKRWIFRNIGFIFMLYAEMIHFIFRIKKGGKDRVQDISLNSFSDVMEAVLHNGGTIYGREMLENYDASEKKDVLMVSHDLTSNGAPVVMIHLAEILSDKGYNVLVMSPRDGDLMVKYILDKGIPVIVDPMLYEDDLVLMSRGLFYRILVNTIIGGSLINKLSGTEVNVIWWIHESSETYTRDQARNMPRKLSDNIQVYVVGPYAKKILSKRCPYYDIRTLVYYSPDLRNAEMSDSYIFGRLDRGKKIYAFIGGWNRRKGQDIAVKAIERLSEKIINQSIFLFVGKPDDEYIMNQISGLKHLYPDNVIITGELELRQVYKLYQKIDYLICASRDDPMPVVVAEAMSVGKPCICSENTGTAAIIHHCKAGFVYRFNSPDRLANVIMESYYLSKKSYESMSQNARKAYSRFFSRKRFEIVIDKIFGQEYDQ